MKFDKTNFALAAGFTAAILSFAIHILMLLMFWGGMMHMRGGMYHMPFMYTDKTGSAGITPMAWCPMTGWGIVAGPILIFFVAAGAGWLFAFFYNKLSKK